jgi:TrmH RNA methyltransferase
MSERRERIYGLEAALAVLHVRPDDVRRIAYHAELGPRLGPLLRDAAARRVAYSEKPDAELRAIAGSDHHEGLVVEALERVILDDAELVTRFGPDRGPLRLVALDGVENPHNVGAIVRTAAFLGVDGVIVPARKPTPLSPAAVRVAEGGAEHVVLGAATDLARVLGALADRGVTVIGADASAADDARTFRYPRRVAIVLGSEAAGASAAVRARFTAAVAVRGTGAVESLNVSVAAGIVLGAATRPSAGP